MRGTAASPPTSPRRRCGSPWGMRTTTHHSWRASPTRWRSPRTKATWLSTRCEPPTPTPGRTGAWNTTWQVRPAASPGAASSALGKGCSPRAARGFASGSCCSSSVLPCSKARGAAAGSQPCGFSAPREEQPTDGLLPHPQALVWLPSLILAQTSLGCSDLLNSQVAEGSLHRG